MGFNDFLKGLGSGKPDVNFFLLQRSKEENLNRNCCETHQYSVLFFIKGPSTLATLFNHKWSRFVAEILIYFIPVGTHYFQALTSTILFVAHVCGGLWLVPATDRAFCGCLLCSAVTTLAIVSNHMWQRLSQIETLRSMRVLLLLL